MSEVIDRIVRTQEAAHVVVNMAYQNAKAILQSGKPVRLVSMEHEADRNLQQNRFYWGPCLREISEQARIGGQRYTAEAWHELFRRQFLGYEIEKVHVAGRKRPVINRRLRSTAKLKVKPFAKYLNQVQAFAATEHGVQFSVRKWEDYEG